ncbi:MAG: hypothetical protein AAGA05_04885 [Pseudomonadota bacterium]
MAPDSLPNIDVYRALVARFFDAEVKGKANPYTSINGNMYSFLDKAGTVCLRLPKDAIQTYQEAFGTGPVTQYGSVMREYVALPHELLRSPDDLADVFAVCRQHALDLPAK